MFAHFGIAFDSFRRHFRRVFAWLRPLFAACEMRGGQSGQSPGQARALPVGPIAMDLRDAGILAWNGCMSHYGFDTAALQMHERAAVRKAVEAAMKAGDTKEMCMAVAALKLREIYPAVNGILASD